VRRQDKTDLWKEVAFVAFDAPAATGPFEDRLALVRDHVDRHQPPYLQSLAHASCEGVDHLRAELARIEALGGEGLMLRQPGSGYEVGRSTTLLKVKSFLDSEAKVLEHLPGAGRHKGRLGALLVELADGTKFSVGTGFSDAERGAPPVVGSLITFRYQELSDGGVPRFPSYVGVRGDIPQPAGEVKETPARVQPTEWLAGQPRRFEFVDGGSSKFWEVSRDGLAVTVRYGRIGTAGQSKTKELGDEAAGVRHAEDLIREKTGKGYVEALQ
jgi:DNA ligase-1